MSESNSHSRDLWGNAPVIPMTFRRTNTGTSIHLSLVVPARDVARRLHTGIPLLPTLGTKKPCRLSGS